MTKRFRRTLLLGLLPGLLLGGMIGVTTAGAEPADLERARALFREGKSRYQAGEYAEAIEAFTAAAQIQSSPVLDFNIGRCYHKQGDAARAIAAYERYLDGKPGAENRLQVQGWIEELQAQLQAAPADPYAELDAGEEPASQPASTPAAPAPPPASEATGAAPGPPPAADDPPHEAALPPSWEGPRSGRAAPAPAGPLAQPPLPAQEGPLYKQWWFWVACAGGAVIAGFILATAFSSPDAPPAGTTRSALQLSF